MALFAIVKTSDSTVEEFREAADAATALSDFAAIPAYNAADYFAHPAPWSTVQRPAVGNKWEYDPATTSLKEVAIPTSKPVGSQSYLTSPDASVWELKIDDAGALSATKT